MKKTISVILAALLTFGCIVSASAAATDYSGTGKTVVRYGDWIYEKIDNDTRYELDEYIGDGGEVIIPRFFGDYLIVSLGDHCFMNNADVTSVITSSPLWTIGEYCFIDCTALESIELNGALNLIGVGAFSGTSSLKSINLHQSVVREIMPYTFLNSGIEEIALPDTCTKLNDYSFAQCYELRKIDIPDSVTEIADTAFDRDENLVIYCSTSSYAHEYAVAKGIRYVLRERFLLGDADGNSKVEIIDATKIQRVLAALDSDVDGMIALRGDADNDGLNILDATKVQRYLAGFVTNEPIGTEVVRVITHDNGE